MSTKHWIGLFTSVVYLFVVGFVEFEPKVTANTSAKPLPVPTTRYIVPNENKEPTLTYEEHMEKEKVAKTISSKYRNIDYTTAMKLVTVVYDNAKKNKLDPKEVLAIIATESSFNPKALSPRNAVGYLQVIPKWHKDKIRGRNIWDMSVNIEVGTKILRDCHKKYSSKRNILGCYNGALSDENKDLYYASVNTNKIKIIRNISI